MSTNFQALDASSLHPSGGAAISTPAPTGPADEVGSTPQSITAGRIAGYGGAEINDYTLIAYLAAWGVFLLLMAILNTTRWGHSLIYYALALVLLLLVVGNYQAFGHVLAPISGQNGPIEGSEPEAPIDTLPGSEPAARESTTAVVTAAAPRFGISGA